MLSISEAAQKLKVTPQQIRNLCRDGKLNAVKVGRSWVVDEASLKKYCSESSAGVAEDRLFYGSDVLIRDDRPIVLSFFSGAMGLDLGIEKAGFQTVFVSEIDNACRKTIVKNKPNVALVGDIRDFTSKDVRRISGLTESEEIDLVIGGPPCQAFSTAGKRKGFQDERGNVFLSFIDMIVNLKPKYAVIENVRGLLSAPLIHRPHSDRKRNETLRNLDELPGGALYEIIKRLKNAGYGVSFNLYNSANFGTPQKRERVVIVCARNGVRPPYLEPTHSENGDYNLPKWRTFREAVCDLDLNVSEYISFPEKRLRYYKLISAGQNWRSLPIEKQIEAMGKSYYSGGGKTGFLRRLSWDKPSPTLVTHPAMPATDLAHPEENRPLSVQEYKKIQEFPDNWEIQGSVLDKYKQIGNAVPVGLGFAIGSLIMKLLKNENVKNFCDFPYSRYSRTNDLEWLEDYEKCMKNAARKILSSSSF